MDWGLHYGINNINIREFEYSFNDITDTNVNWNAMDVALDTIRFDMDFKYHKITRCDFTLCEWIVSVGIGICIYYGVIL